MATEPNSIDIEIVARFEAYRAARIAYNQFEGDDDVNPSFPTFDEAERAMTAAPVPSSLEGAVTWLHFMLLSNCTTWDEEHVLLANDRAEITAFVRDNWDGFNSSDRGYWGALAVLQSLDPIRAVAEAWVDRWRALGGDFGAVRRPGEPATATRGMLMALEYWKPTDRDNPRLAPHAWLTEKKHHAGAVKALEGMLELVPDLQDAVFDLVAPTIPGLREEAA